MSDARIYMGSRKVAPMMAISAGAVGRGDQIQNPLTLRPPVIRAEIVQAVSLIPVRVLLYCMSLIQ